MTVARGFHEFDLSSDMKSENTAPKKPIPDELRTWRVGSTNQLLGAFPWIMGIVNATPDSFSDGGRFLDEEAAVDHALALVADGADILDVGGESTRPGSQPVELEEELRRVLPVVRRLAKETNALISIDTTKAEVARQAIEAGADIVNDISGLRFDEQMAAVCRESGAAVICMHMQGTPQTMQENPTYNDAVTDIATFFGERLESLERAGIERERIVLDPGVGFGKTAAHNLEILSAIEQFRALGRPVLIGHSRKRFLSKVLNRDVDERTSGTIGVAIALATQHTDIIRVHDVRAVRDAVTAWQAVTDRID
jgi:dihydropteroate synthase